MTSPTSRRSASEEPAEAFIRSVDIAAIRDLALNIRIAQISTDSSPLAGDISCSVFTPPKYGSYNVVYELQFSDGVAWAMRLPFSEWTPLAARNMELDMMALNYIVSQVPIPIPTIHAYSSSADNPVRNAYVVMDKAHGIPLGEVWHDSTWWTGLRRRENFFESLAQNMVQLSSLPFNRIGRLVSTRSDGSTVVGPFPSLNDMFFIFEAPHEEFGPFDTTHEYLSALLRVRRRAYDSPALALFQLFISGPRV
ncbi:hypothetical protein FKP32DRAFT_261680 [Trametes sanguinea]|nr:hypothetical protein FKP32DRAFT_261680 [Trametes sanguinea]